jgi:hypothetical protein
VQSELPGPRWSLPPGFEAQRALPCAEPYQGSRARVHSALTQDTLQLAKNLPQNFSKLFCSLPSSYAAASVGESGVPY